MSPTQFKWYKMEDFMKLRGDADCFEFFCTNFLSCVVGLKRWPKSCLSKRVSEVASVTDEGFALLTLENNWDPWEAAGEKK